MAESRQHLARARFVLLADYYLKGCAWQPCLGRGGEAALQPCCGGTAGSAAAGAAASPGMAGSSRQGSLLLSRAQICLLCL